MVDKRRKFLKSASSRRCKLKLINMKKQMSVSILLNPISLYNFTIETNAVFTLVI